MSTVDGRYVYIHHLRWRTAERLCEAKPAVVDRTCFSTNLLGNENVFNIKTMNVYINKLRNYLDDD